MHQEVSGPSKDRALERFIRDARGDAAVEYLFLVGTIALPAIIAFLAVGHSIVSDYTTMQNVLILPLP